MNNISISGFITKEATLKHIGIGEKKIARVDFCIAQSKLVKSKKESMFFDVTFYNLYAEKIYPQLQKGKLVFIQGELTQDRWEKNGQKHSKISIIGNRINIIESKPQTPINKPTQTPQPTQNTTNNTLETIPI